MIMFDNVDPRDTDATHPRARGERPPADREVPIGRAIPADIHRWLDGELAETAVAQRGELARHVELWHRLASDIERRRRLTMPGYVVTRIMEAVLAR